MYNGWVKIHRKLIEWEWFTDVNVAHLFLYCILSANHEDRKWRGIDIKRGTFVTSLDSLADSTGLSVRQVRTALDKLERTGEISQETTNKYRVVTISKYEDYQLIEDSERQTNDKQETNKCQTNDKQMTTNKNDKNYKNNILSSSSYSEGAVEIDFPKLAEYWNEKTKGIFHPIVGADFDSNEERRLRTLDIINTFGKEQFLIAIEKAIHSDFLKDRSRAFWFNYDWMIVRRNFDSLINGHYDKNKQYGNDTTKRPNRPSVQDVSTPTEGSTCDF